MTEKNQQNSVRRYAPVLILVIALVIIGIVAMMVYMPQQGPEVPPENDAPFVPDADSTASAAMHTITWENDCSYPVWVDIIGGLQWKSPNDGKMVGACGFDTAGQCNPLTRCDQIKGCGQGDPLVDGGGFKLEANGGTHTSSVPANWQGGFWGRTGCTGTDDDLTCDWKTCYGSDGKGKLQCGGSGLSQATKGEIDFDQNGFDTYDVSAVDGFNVPMTIEPVAGTFVNKGSDKVYDCTVSGTSYDLKDPSIFPATLSKDLIIKVGKSQVAVLSACQYSVYSTGKENHAYCCSAPDHNTPATCNPKNWPATMRTDLFFKKYLPGAYSWAFDDHTSTYTCWSKDTATRSSYKVTFCGKKAAAEGGAVPASGQGTVTVTTPGAPATALPTQTPLSTQTAVPSGPYNPAGDDGSTF